MKILHQMKWIALGHLYHCLVNSLQSVRLKKIAVARILVQSTSIKQVLRHTPR